MKLSFLLFMSLFFLAIIVVAQDGVPIDNWCDTGGPWNDGRCNEGTEYEQDWHWTCGWYMAQVDNGLLTIDQLRENVPLCSSLYRSDYVLNILPTAALPLETATPLANPTSSGETNDVTSNPTLSTTATSAPETVTSIPDDYKILRVGFGPNEPESIDPALTDFGTGEQILSQTYMGLVALDEEALTIVPAIASSWEITENEDRTYTYTFYLRDDVPWVHYHPASGQVETIGSMVKASDFVFGLERVVQEDYYLASYVLAPEIISMEAIDDYVLQITSPHAQSYQLAVFAQWFAFAQPEWIINQFGDTWTEDNHFVSYGPYALKEWSHDEKITLVRNPYWFDEVKIDEIQFFIGDADEQLDDFQDGHLDYLWDVPASQSSMIESSPVLSERLTTVLEAGTYFYGLNIAMAPFDNVHCRLAFSYAINRQTVVDAIQFGQAAPYFSSPNMIAAPQPEDYPNLGISYDPQRAISELDQCLGEKGLGSVDSLPRPTLVFNSGGSHYTIASLIQEMWLDILGVEVELVEVEFSVLIEERDQYAIWRSAWLADFPDSHSSMSAFVSNEGYYADIVDSATYDQLLEAAQATSDLSIRTELYAQANQLLVADEALIIPLYWYERIELTQPYINRTTSRLPYERYDKWDINRS